MEVDFREDLRSFDLQFANSQTVEFPQGYVTIVDVEPHNPVDQTPILLAPGWSENEKTYKKSMRTIFSGNRRGISLSHPGRGGAVDEIEDFPEVEVRHAEEILGVLNLKGIERTDAIFHSEGALSGLIAASLRPELFRNVVLDKPAGLIGYDGKMKLVGRFIKLLAQEGLERKPLSFTDPTNSFSSSLRTITYMMLHRELFNELEALTSMDIVGLIHNLEEQGVMIAVIAGPSDPLFPVKRQIEHLRESKFKTRKNLPIEGYYSVKGGHNELSINADKHTALAVDALKNMQRRRDRKS